MIFVKLANFFRNNFFILICMPFSGKKLFFCEITLLISAKLFFASLAIETHYSNFEIIHDNGSISDGVCHSERSLFLFEKSVFPPKYQCQTRERKLFSDKFFPTGL